MKETMKTAQPDGYLAQPKSGKGPGVLVLHAWWGLNDFFKDLCERLAGEGFVAFAPDLYGGKVATTIAEAEQLLTALDEKQNEKRILGEVVNAAQYLAGLDAVTGKSLGVIGFSFGAYYALGLSVEKPEIIRAAALFYGNGGGDFSRAKAAYLGHFAASDEWEPAEGVRDLEERLRAAGREVAFHTYEGTGHWFFENNRKDAYNAEAAKLAWERTVQFLHKTLS